MSRSTKCCSCVIAVVVSRERVERHHDKHVAIIAEVMVVAGAVPYGKSPVSHAQPSSLTCQPSRHYLQEMTVCATDQSRPFLGHAAAGHLLPNKANVVDYHLSNKANVVDHLLPNKANVVDQLLPNKANVAGHLLPNKANVVDHLCKRQCGVLP